MKYLSGAVKVKVGEKSQMKWYLQNCVLHFSNLPYKWFCNNIPKFVSSAIGWFCSPHTPHTGPTRSLHSRKSRIIHWKSILTRFSSLCWFFFFLSAGKRFGPWGPLQCKADDGKAGKPLKIVNNTFFGQDLNDPNIIIFCKCINIISKSVAIFNTFKTPLPFVSNSYSYQHWKSRLDPT